MLHREYMAARARRWEEREAFRRLFRRRHPSVAVRYPAELHDLPRFASWLTSQLNQEREAGKDVDIDVQKYAQPPE
jgi:hypothetical protein